jgi:type IV secretory pathway VirB4 component
MAPPAKSEYGNSLDLVDIQEIRENIVITKSGGLKQIVMVGGVNFALKSELEQNIITQGYQTFLNSIDFPLQIIIHSRKVNVEKYLTGLLARKESEESALLRSQMDEYAEFIRGFIQKNAIMEKTFLVIVPFYPKSLAEQRQSFMKFVPFLGKPDTKKDASGKTQSEEDKEKFFKENQEQLSQRTSQVMSNLLNIGLEATLLENDALIELFYNFYNPQTVEREDIALPS